MDLETSESLKLWEFYTFILAFKCAQESLPLIAHTSFMLTYNLIFESRVSQLHLLMEKSGDESSGRESVVLKHYPIVKAIWSGELNLSFSTVINSARETDIWTLVSSGATKIWPFLHLRNPGEKKAEPGTLEHEILDGTSGLKGTFYIIILK